MWPCPNCRAPTAVDTRLRHRTFRRGLAVPRTRRCGGCGFEGITAEFWLDDMPRAAAQLVPRRTVAAPPREHLRLTEAARGLTIAEAAVRTRRQPELLRRWCREGWIRAMRTRSGWRIAESHLELPPVRDRPSQAEGRRRQRVEARCIRCGELELDGRYEQDVAIAGGVVHRRRKGSPKSLRGQYGHTPPSVREVIAWAGRRCLAGTGVDG